MDETIEISELRKALKFQLPVTHSEKFNSWWKNIYFRYDPHHILGRKVTDYFQVPLERKDHQDHHKDPNKNFVEDLITSMKILFNYITELEEQMGKKSQTQIDIEKKIEELKKRRDNLKANIAGSEEAIRQLESNIEMLESILFPPKGNAQNIE